MDETPRDEGKIDAEKIKQVMGDKSKVNEMIEKLKKDRSIMPTAMKKFNEDQVTRRNMMNASAAIAPSQKMGSEVPINTRRKLAKQQATIKALAKQSATYRNGEVTCINILPNGKMSTVPYLQEDFEDDKYVVRGAVINGVPFLVIMSAMTYGKTNKIATSLLNTRITGEEMMVCCGPVTFMMLDEDYKSAPVTVAEFSTIVDEELHSRN